MLKRILPVILTVSILICCIVIPASATEYDFFDYITNITVDGNNDYVEVTLPYVGYTAYYYQGEYFAGYWGNPFGRKLTNTHYYDIIATPLGKQHNINPGIGYLYDGGFLNIDDLPPDSQVTTYVVLQSDVGTLSIGSGSLIYYYMGNELVNGSVKLEKITSNSGNAVVDGGSKIILQDTFSSFGDYKYFWPVIYIANLTNSPTSVVTFDASVKLSFKVSSAYMDYVETGKNKELIKAIDAQLKSQGQTLSGVLEQQAQTNEKLQDLLDQQEQTNDKLDGITDYEGTPERPGWQDSADEYEDLEQDALDNVQSGLDDANNAFDSVLETLSEYFGSFAALSILFNLFAEIPFFSALLYVSLCLGIVAAIFGIGLDAVRASSRASARSSRKARSG